MSSTPPPVFRVHASPSSAAEALVDFICDEADASIAARGKFSLALSGGSVATAIPAALDAAVARGRVLRTVDWVIFYADERLVPASDAASNHGTTLRAIERFDWWRARAVPVDTSLPHDAAATAYEAALVHEVGARGVLDVVVLGLGPDGHTASLFPGHALLAESARLVASLDDSPKQPPTRVTLTLPTLRAARNVTFFAAGADKADMLARVAIAHPTDVDAPPSARVYAADGARPSIFYVDQAAANALSEEARARTVS